MREALLTCDYRITRARNMLEFARNVLQVIIFWLTESTAMDHKSLISIFHRESLWKVVSTGQKMNGGCKSSWLWEKKFEGKHCLFYPAHR